jgi:hypothetical protein
MSRHARVCFVYRYDVLSKPAFGGCQDTPGPASSKLYCVKSTNPSYVAFRWYRFIDQPGLQQLNLSSVRTFLISDTVAFGFLMFPEN